MKEKIPNCVCKNCKKEFYKKPANIKDTIGDNHFCSIKCYRQYKNIEDRYCINCNKILNHEQNKFCSTSCAAIINNKLYPHKRKLQSYCINCNKLLNRTGKKYCNVKCQASYRRNQFIQKWLNNEIDGTISTGCSNTIRDYLLKQANYKCSKCGWKEVNVYSGNVPLEVEHIDGDWRNNKLENLIILCPNCHSLTPTYRALNKRKSDRKVKGQRKKW